MEFNDFHSPGSKIVYNPEEKEEVVKINYKEIVKKLVKVEIEKNEAIKECEAIKAERIIALRVIKEFGGVPLLKKVCAAIAKATTRERWGYIVELDEDEVFEEPKIEGYSIDYKFPCPARIVS